MDTGCSHTKVRWPEPSTNSLPSCLLVLVLLVFFWVVEMEGVVKTREKGPHTHTNAGCQTSAQSGTKPNQSPAASPNQIKIKELAHTWLTGARS